MKTLIIGYGNPLRGDDGLGWRVAQILSAENQDPDVQVFSRHQLTPELAENLSRSNLAIFIDTRVGKTQGLISIEKVSPQKTHSSFSFSHQLNPSQLLATAQTLYDHCPESFLFSVESSTFGFSDTLSPTLEAKIPELIQSIHQLIIEKSKSTIQPIPESQSWRYENAKSSLS